MSKIDFAKIMFYKLRITASTMLFGWLVGWLVGWFYGMSNFIGLFNAEINFLLQIIIWFQIFLFNTNNFYTIIWFQVFKVIIWFEVTNNNELFTFKGSFEF